MIAFSDENITVCPVTAGLLTLAIKSFGLVLYCDTTLNVCKSFTLPPTEQEVNYRLCNAGVRRTRNNLRGKKRKGNS